MSLGFGVFLEYCIEDDGGGIDRSKKMDWNRVRPLGR